MNGKKAKLLRRIAQNETVGEPKVAYIKGTGIPPRFEKIGNIVTKKETVPDINIRQVTRGIPLRLIPKCTREFYKTLKNKYKAGEL